MENLPIYIYLIFGATVLLAIGLFYKATDYAKSFLVLVIAWLIIQSVVAISGFYNNAETITKRFPLLVLPPVLFIVSMFFTKRGKTFIDGLNIKILTLFHVIRIPVEIVLYWLFIYHFVPKAVTFEGRNFDVLSGLTAPIIYYFGFVKKSISNQIVIVWNIVCLLLLLNVAANAMLSLPTRYLQFGFEQPNVALAYFPFVLLPTLLVPMVLFAHLATIRQLIKK